MSTADRVVNVCSPLTIFRSAQQCFPLLVGHALDGDTTYLNNPIPHTSVFQPPPSIPYSQYKKHKKKKKKSKYAKTSYSSSAGGSHGTSHVSGSSGGHHSSGGGGGGDGGGTSSSSSSEDEGGTMDVSELETLDSVFFEPLRISGRVAPPAPALIIVVSVLCFSQ